MAERSVRELARIPFAGPLGNAFQAYSREAEDLARRFSFELEVAASDSRAAMESLRGHPLLFGLDAKIKARRVAARLKRAKELIDGMGHEAARFERSYRKNFKKK
jgi:hypothetical protein